MELIRDQDKVIIRWPRGRVAFFGLSFVGGLFCLIGMLALFTGQHLPKLSSTFTFIWAFLIGIPTLSLGLSFLGFKRVLTFGPNGLHAYFSKWRFIEWNLRYSRKQLQAIFIEPQSYGDLSRLIIQINGHNDLEITRNLPTEEAWRIASILAEVTGLPIEGS